MEARKKTDLCEIFNNSSVVDGQGSEQPHAENSRSKVAQILEIISDEIGGLGKENSNVELPEDTGKRAEHPKHARYKSLIAKTHHGNNLNSSSLNPEGKAQNLKASQQNKSFDLEKQAAEAKLMASFLKTPPDPKIQSKALYGYFFPNNYIPGHSLNMNNNTGSH